MKQILILIGLIGLVAVVGAQSMEKMGPDAPVANADYKSGCFAAAVKMYRATTDTSQTLEEMQKELLAAQAFERLDALNQDC